MLHPAPSLLRQATAAAAHEQLSPCLSPFLSVATRNVDVRATITLSAAFKDELARIAEEIAAFPYRDRISVRDERRSRTRMRLHFSVAGCTPVLWAAEKRDARGRLCRRLRRHPAGGCLCLTHKPAPRRLCRCVLASSHTRRLPPPAAPFVRAELPQRLEEAEAHLSAAAVPPPLHIADPLLDGLGAEESAIVRCLILRHTAGSFRCCFSAPGPLL